MNNEQVKIYISGQITGFRKDEVQARFEHAAELVRSLGMIPVNPLKNGLSEGSGWAQHMVRDIEMLMPCDGILMMRGWTQSKGARIEHNIAWEMGKNILFEDALECGNLLHEVVKVQRAIQQVTGLRIEQYSTKCRERKYFNARMLFVRECLRKGLSMREVSKRINRNRSTVIYTKLQYESNVKYDPDFREIAEEVERILE